MYGQYPVFSVKWDRKEHGITFHVVNDVFSISSARNAKINTTSSYREWLGTQQGWKLHLKKSSVPLT